MKKMEEVFPSFINFTVQVIIISLYKQNLPYQLLKGTLFYYQQSQDNPLS